MSAIDTLLSEFSEWSDDRAEIVDAESEGNAASSDWQASDDTAFGLLARMAHELQLIKDALTLYKEATR